MIVCLLNTRIENNFVAGRGDLSRESKTPCPTPAGRPYIKKEGISITAIKAGAGRRGAGSGKPLASKGKSGMMDLSGLFGVAAQALAANQGMLNQADAQNGNHGDNMVQMFNMITQVMNEQKRASTAQQLNQVSQYLSQNATSGSAQVYAQGLAHAAQQFQGQKSLNQNNAMMLVQSLLGGGQTPAGRRGHARLTSRGGDAISADANKAS